MQIKNRILTIRNKQVMIDKNLAEFYEIETKTLNQAVKRNLERFPEEFMFQLNDEEFDSLRSQFVTTKENRGGRRYLPYVFTEQGVSMLSAVLHSKKAIQISIQIINAFVELRNFHIKNKDIFQRLNIVETKLLEHDNNFNKAFKLLETKQLDKGVFFEGQLFDSYKFISDLIRQAKKEIRLIDNYVDERTLNLFTKTKVKVIIYTKNITNILKKDLEKYNSQYNNQIEVREFALSHDRFLIIDKKVYHIGASLKDLGSKWFAFSKLDDFYKRILFELERSRFGGKDVKIKFERIKEEDLQTEEEQGKMLKEMGLK